MQTPPNGRYRVLDTIRQHGEISRIELAALTDLSRGAVTGITQGLLDEGLIVEGPGKAGQAGGRRGRPRVMLSIAPGAGHVLGIKLSLHEMSFSVADFRGEVVHVLSLPFRGNQRCAVALDMIEAGVRHCLRGAGLGLAGILGICVGVPGYVNYQAGICHWSPIFVDRDLPLAARLQDRLQVPVFIENDANLVALAELWFGEGRGRSCFAVVTIEHGIGMGLIVDRRLYRGAQGIAPELGHAKVEVDGLPCRCGQSGCVEAYASDYAILRAADPAFSLVAYAENPAAYQQSLADLTARAHAGDAAVAAIFRDAGTRLGQAVANLLAILNPPTVIFTGDGMRAGNLIIGPAIAEARRLKLPGNSYETAFIPHVWGNEVWARGAAALMLQHLYASPASPARSRAGLATATPPA